MEIDKRDFIVGVCDKYDNKLLEKRREIEGNTIGCIAGDLLLIDDSMLKPSDYVTRDGRFLFSMLKSLMENINIKGLYVLYALMKRATFFAR